MLKSYFKKHTFNFITPGGTSRGILDTKDSWHIIIYDDDSSEQKGIGECSLIYGLSIDNTELIEKKLREVTQNIENWQFYLEEGLNDFPAIRFGLETAIKDFALGGQQLLFPSDFTEGNAAIPINGLIWMGDYNTMRKRIAEKVDDGFRCIKIKIGAIDFEEEIKLLKSIRKDFTADSIEIRVDANGAFSPNSALEKLNRISDFEIHSIEQPISPRQWDKMAELCQKSPVPIALDEELIGLLSEKDIIEMLKTISPQYIILKPSLVGGLRQCQRFIDVAEPMNIRWWITSALEGNIGLNAIAQWTHTLDIKMPQGLGTGMLFSNNIPSPLEIINAKLTYSSHLSWDISEITGNE